MNKATKFMSIGVVALVCILATCLSSMAIDFPLPINGRLDFNDFSKGQEIKITNERTMITESVIVNDDSEYLYDWANSDNKGATIARYVMGDSFKIVISDCKGDCEKYVTYTGQPEIFIAWNLQGSTLEDKTPKEEEQDVLGILGLIIALILSIGGGMQIYKNRKGGITVLHRHRGITGYHNPDTQHRNIKYRHAKLTRAPVQYAKDIKKIEEKGGLI